jgi:serine/threonine-protein kinase RsbW
MDPNGVEQRWLVPNQLETAFAMVYEIQAWIDALPIPEDAKYFTYAALEELISNKIKYGFNDTNERFIAVQITAGDTVIRLELTDDGHEFDPTAHPPPDIARNLDDGVAGGLGIELVRRICTHMEYRREGNLNRVTFCLDVE